VNRASPWRSVSVRTRVADAVGALASLIVLATSVTAYVVARDALQRNLDLDLSRQVTLAERALVGQ
jgi:hypothetical protein